jgi:hypothetical protein
MTKSDRELIERLGVMEREADEYYLYQTIKDPEKKKLLRAAIERLSAGRGWRLIESAPKDGTPVLVARHHVDFGWVRGWAHWEDVRGISGWISRGFFEVVSNLGLAHPTHWQPLPAPPSEQGEEKIGVPSDRVPPSDELVEAVARAIYEDDPHYEAGEYVDGFQVSPGGDLTWEQAQSRDAEFGDEPRMLRITDSAYKGARAAIAAYQKFTAGDPRGEARPSLDAARREALAHARELIASQSSTTVPVTDQEMAFKMAYALLALSPPVEGE